MNTFKLIGTLAGLFTVAFVAISVNLIKQSFSQTYERALRGRYETH